MKPSWERPPDDDEVWHVMLVIAASFAILAIGQWVSCWNMPAQKVCGFLGLP